MKSAKNHSSAGSQTEVSKPHDYTQINNGIGLFCGSHSPNQFAEHFHPEIQVIVPFERTRCIAYWHTDGGRTVTRNVHPWHTCVTAGNQPHGSDWRAEAEMVIFYLVPEFIGNAAFDLMKIEKPELIGNNLTEDRLIQQIAGVVRREIALGGDLEPLYFESLANILAVHLIRDYSAERNLLKDKKYGLSNHRLNRATSFMNEYLAAKISLSEIAQAVGISPFHFARSFKQSTGITPYQYLSKQRIEKAKTLLVETGLPVTEIAQQVGCSNQTHFSTFFRRAVGTTPKEFRRSQTIRRDTSNRNKSDSIIFPLIN